MTQLLPPKGLQEFDKDIDERTEEEADGSESSSSSDGEGIKAEADALSLYNSYEVIEMVSGNSDSSYIHVLDPSKNSREGSVGTGCNARPRQETAKFGNLAQLRSLNRRFCPRCTASWPADVRLRASA